MSHYDTYMQSLKDKFGVQCLETEPEKRTINLPVGDASPSRADLDYVPSLKRKYNLPNGLEVEGIAHKEEMTVQDFVTEKERDAMRGMKLSYGSTSFKGRPLKVWFEISR